MDGISSLMALGVIVAVIVPRNIVLDKVKAFMCEAAKSAVASTLWLLLVVDAILGPWKDKPSPLLTRVRVARVVTGIVILL